VNSFCFFTLLEGSDCTSIKARGGRLGGNLLWVDILSSLYFRRLLSYGEAGFALAVGGVCFTYDTHGVTGLEEFLELGSYMAQKLL